MLVVIVMEEEPLRSDTRLPLESSPYMAGIFFYNSQLAARSNVFFPFDTVASD